MRTLDLTYCVECHMVFAEIPSAMMVKQNDPRYPADRLYFQDLPLLDCPVCKKLTEFRQYDVLRDS